MLRWSSGQGEHSHGYEVSRDPIMKEADAFGVPHRNKPCVVTMGASHKGHAIIAIPPIWHQGANVQSYHLWHQDIQEFICIQESIHLYTS